MEVVSGKAGTHTATPSPSGMERHQQLSCIKSWENRAGTRGRKPLKHGAETLLTVLGNGTRDLIYDFICNPFKMSWYQYVISGLCARPK